MLNQSKKLLLLIAVIGLAFGASISAMQSQKQKDRLNKELSDWATSFEPDMSQLDRLLAQGADINSFDSHGFTVLINAVRERRLPQVEELIAHGADVNLRLSDEAHTALMVAAKNGSLAGNEDIVKVLLQAGADIYAVLVPMWTFDSTYNSTALKEAARNEFSMFGDYLKPLTNIARMILEKATTLTNDDKAAIKNWLLVNQRLGKEQRNLPRDPRTMVAQRIYASFPALLRERLIRAGAIEALKSAKGNYRPNPELARLIEQYLDLNFLVQRVREQLPWIGSTLPQIQGK